MEKALLFLVVILFILGFSLLVPQVQRNIVKLVVVTGRLEVAQEAPQVRYIYMEDIQLPTSPTGIPAFDGAEDSTQPLDLKATVYDENGDCNGNFTWYICTNDTLESGPCSSTNYDYKVSDTSADQQWGGPQNNLYCNFSASFNLEYFKRCGIATIYGVATDVQGNTNSSTVYWKYNAIQVLSFYPYPYESVIDFGLIAAGAWKNTTVKTLKNTGNVQFNALWNATDFYNATYGTIDVTGNNYFGLDKDTSPGNEGWIENPPTQITYPTTPIKRCGNFGCTVDEDGSAPNDAMFDLYWKLYIPLGVNPAIYTNNIETLAEQVTQC